MGLHPHPLKDALIAHVMAGLPLKAFAGMSANTARAIIWRAGLRLRYVTPEEIEHLHERRKNHKVAA